jgi:hypothetical protein
MESHYIALCWVQKDDLSRLTRVGGSPKSADMATTPIVNILLNYHIKALYEYSVYNSVHPSLHPPLCVIAGQETASQIYLQLSQFLVIVYRQEMLTFPRHLIPPLVYLDVHVCPVLGFVFPTGFMRLITIRYSFYSIEVLLTRSKYWEAEYTTQWTFSISDV